MCGIAGIVHSDSSRPVDPRQLKAMTDAIIHRGPDAEGAWIEGPVGLGHRRLSIIDLGSGDQPMKDRFGNVISFNGEIYNYLELRGELRALGHEFYSESDTEVILAAYREWGVDCQNRLNGMWAFAIWDEREQRLFLSRDRLGEKPLYYARQNGTLCFGSEIKCLVEAGVPADADLTMLEVYLCLSYVPAPYSFYRHINALEPGHCLTLEDGRLREWAYWDLPEIDERAMLSDSKVVDERFEELLSDSIRMRMRSDVPFGAFLSGGLDSASVVALMTDHTSHAVETFTMGFDDEAYDERHLARDVAEKFGTNHHEQLVAPDSFDEALARVIHHYDDPFGDSSAIPTGYVSGYARDHVKMVLTGDGGDEVLSGYTVYQGEKFAGRYGMLPGAVQRVVPAMIGRAAGSFRGKNRYRMNRAQKVCDASSRRFESRLVSKIAWGNEGNVKALLRNVPFATLPVEEFVGDVMAKCSYRDPFYKLMYYHLKCSLPNDMLVKVDRMSMAHSLETRVPFLDHRLVEFMVGVDKTVKMDGFERKSVLRRSVGRRLPESLLRAPKKGFGVPLREWFKDKSFSSKLDQLKNLDAGLDSEVLSGVIEDTVDGRRDHGNFLWMLFVAERWLGGDAGAVNQPNQTEVAA